MAFLVKGRSFAVKEEASYGTFPTILDADYVDYISGDITADVESITRDVIRNSLLNVESVLGQETSAGTITVELSGDDTTYGVNGDLLYKNGLGVKIDSTTATTVASAVDAENITVADPTGLAVGQVLKIDMAGGAEYVTIVSIATADLVVTPALSGTPIGAEPVTGLTTYLIGRPDTTVASLGIREHLKSTTGTEIDYDYSGVMVSDVALDFPVGGIATAAFTIAGAGFATTTGAGAISLPCSTRTPVVGKNSILTVDGVSLEAQDVSISVATEITDVNALTSDGISNKIGVAKTITVSFRVEYTGVGNLDRLQAGTLGNLMLQLKDGGSTSPVIVGAYLPSIKFTAVTKSEDGGIMYDNVEAEILDTGCTGNSRAISLFFA